MSEYADVACLVGLTINEINVKKLQFIHTLTATNVHASKTAKIKKLYTMPLHIDV